MKLSLLVLFLFSVCQSGEAAFTWEVSGGELKPGGHVRISYDISSFKVHQNRVLRGLKSLIINIKDPSWKAKLDFEKLDEDSPFGTLEFPIDPKADLTKPLACQLDFIYKTSNPTTREVPVKDKTGKVVRIEKQTNYGEHRYQRMSQPIFLDFNRVVSEESEPPFYLNYNFIFTMMVLFGALYYFKYRKPARTIIKMGGQQ